METSNSGKITFDDLKQKYNFQHIKLKKEYIDLRLQLENSFILFFAYEEDSLSKLEEYISWFEFLEEAKIKFKEKLKLVLFSNKSESKLVEVLKLDGETEISSIEYPRAILCHPRVTDPEVISDLSPYDLYKIIEHYNTFYLEHFEKEKLAMFNKIKKLLDSYPVVIFIKGTPHDPFCKFSKQFIQIIKETGIRYKSFDIFKDESLRSYLRLYSGWKTYPQLYVHSKIIGGLDKVKDLINSGEFLKNIIPFECTKEGVIHSFSQFVEINPLIVFGKGNIETAKCKSTKEMYKILLKNGITYANFDVLRDEMVREYVKTINNYLYYPQIVLFGKFLGGLKFLKEIVQQHRIFYYIPLKFHAYYIEHKDNFNSLLLNAEYDFTKVYLNPKDSKKDEKETYSDSTTHIEKIKEIFVDDYPQLKLFFIEILKLNSKEFLLIDKSTLLK